MSWNTPENRITEKQLNALYDTDATRAELIRTQWEPIFDPRHNQHVFVNPTAKAELRKALLSTLKYQPKTEEDKIKERLFNPL
mgnify:FL=1